MTGLLIMERAVEEEEQVEILSNTGSGRSNSRLILSGIYFPTHILKYFLNLFEFEKGHRGRREHKTIH